MLVVSIIYMIILLSGHDVLLGSVSLFFEIPGKG